MDLLLNVVLAWISVALMLILSIVFLLRVINQTFYERKHPVLTPLNKALRKHHKGLGISVIVTSILHGIYSSTDLFSINLGTGLLVILLLMGLSFMFRVQLKHFKSWIVIHRHLTVLSIVILVIHIIDVGGFVGVDRIATALMADPLINSTAEASPIVTTTTVEQTSGPYVDGTYSGTANGYRPGLQVEVIIQNGFIASVVVTDHNEKGQQFWGVPVEQIPLAIVAEQSTNVDVISGATYTSRGIMAAVENALLDAKK